MIKIEKYKNILPMILIILDGWGIDKPNRGNAVCLAKTPTMNGIMKKYPNTKLIAHGSSVGLPEGQPGNSEAGHMNIGAGRIVDQEVISINKSIENGIFFKTAAFLEAIHHVKKQNGRLHLMGLLSDGMSPHSDPNHILALLKLAREHEVKNVCLHLFTDGRDSRRFAGLKLVEDLQKHLVNGETICTIMGRFYAMDRKKIWERTEKAYNALVLGEGRIAESAQSAITEAYNRSESDEYIEPYVIIRDKKITPRIEDNDSLIFFNLRSDRSRQLAKVFVQEDFTKMNPGSFRRKKVFKTMHFVALTNFGPDLGNILTAFPSVDLQQTMPVWLSGLRQLYIAETEKYAHVTYFFNGGYSRKVDDEDLYMVPSPNVESYDEVPAMSSGELTKIVNKNVINKRYDFTVLNFAAPDMIGHTGNLETAIKCCGLVDKYLGSIIKAYLRANGTILVTADHGNIEQMLDINTDEVLTEHTTNQVPFVLVNNKLKNVNLRNNGMLADIAPTILALLQYDKPEEMTGTNLIINNYG